MKKVNELLTCCNIRLVYSSILVIVVTIKESAQSGTKVFL